MITYSTHYEGKVQGVGFRASVLGLARGYDVTGHVQNLSDGRVEIIAQGDPEEVEDFFQAIRESHLASHILAEQKNRVETEARFRGFKIIAS